LINRINEWITHRLLSGSFFRFCEYHLPGRIHFFEQSPFIAALQTFEYNRFNFHRCRNQTNCWKLIIEEFKFRIFP